MWLFGQLNTLGENGGAAQENPQLEKDAKVVMKGLSKLMEKGVTAPEKVQPLPYEGAQVQGGIMRT